MALHTILGAKGTIATALLNSNHRPPISATHVLSGTFIQQGFEGPSLYFFNILNRRPFFSIIFGHFLAVAGGRKRNF